MHLDNQPGERVGPEPVMPDPVMPDMAADDARDPLGSDLRRHIRLGRRIVLDF
jgi:hypothetical protein